VTEAGDGSVRNPKDDYSSVNPRLGVIFSLGDVNEIFASASRLFEAPTTFEMEDDVRQDNQTLEPMKGTVVEVGMRGSTDAGANTRWRWDASIYYAQIDDEILSIDDVTAPGTSLTTNIDATTHAGLEALVGASFAFGAHRLEPLLSFTWNDFSFDSDPTYGNNRLPAAPRYAARGELMYRHVNGFYAGPTFDFIGKRFADFANTYVVDAYGLLGLRGGYTAKSWEAFVELRNVLDEDYIATVGVLNEAGPDAAVLNPGAPLSAYAGFRVSL
jgi:iron complex outermembrane receptor protein